MSATRYEDYPHVDQPTEHLGPPAGLTIEEAFEAFHAANPHVYNALVDMAWQAKGRRVRRVGMKMMFEVLRWNHALQTGGDDFKLNNNYTSYYARRIMMDDRALHFRAPAEVPPPCDDDDTDWDPDDDALFRVGDLA